MNKHDRKRLADLEKQNRQSRQALLVVCEWMVQQDPLVRAITQALGVRVALHTTHKRKAD